MASRGHWPTAAAILLVEDNAVNQWWPPRSPQAPSSRLWVAGNGREALDISGHSTSTSFQDVHMPEMGGIEATSKIRERERTTGRHIPIIAMTASAMVGDRERASRRGWTLYREAGQVRGSVSTIDTVMATSDEIP